MSYVTEKAAILADCLRDRVDFYRRWYSQHTMEETVGGFFGELAREAGSHSKNLDRYLNPVLGGIGGTAVLFTGIVSGLPAFARGVAAGRIKPMDIVRAGRDALVAANDLVVSYATGGAPEGAFERSFEATRTLGAAILVLYGAKSATAGAARITRGLASKTAGAFPPAALVTAEGVVTGPVSVSGAGALLATGASGLAGGLVLSTAKGPANERPSNEVAPIDKYRAMSDKKLLDRAKTLERLASTKGKRRHLIKKIAAEESADSVSSTRKLSSDMTVAEKRAFLKVLVERSMEGEAIKLMAEWEKIERVKGALRLELAARGTKLRPSPGPHSVSSGFYSSLDDASLARVAEKVVKLLRKDAGRKAHVARLWPEADPYVIREVANLGEFRGLVEKLDLSGAGEIASELALRGFADDAFILEKLLAGAGH